MGEMKLQKILQGIGWSSRRNIREAINEGRFSINGVVSKDPNILLDPQKDHLKFDENRVKVKFAKKVYYIFNKPIGVLTTLKDPQGRKNISHFIKKIPQRVYPVGRLDYNSQGLIFLTNDGDLADFIINSKNRVPKTYLVKVKGMPSKAKLDFILKKGAFVEGQKIKPISISFVKKTKTGNSWIRVAIYEGKKHVIRKLMLFNGFPVEKLKRSAIGNIKLGNLPIGYYRQLKEEDIDIFKKKFMGKERINNIKS